MRDDLDRLLRDTTFVTLALAIAAGWALYQLAHGVSTFFDGLVARNNVDVTNYLGLTWVVDGRIVTLDGVFTGVVELAVVLWVANWVHRRMSRST